ncbi:MAG: alpha/beta fold hydrolase [Treponema sp.]|nr:alpha/beta fold hydrolase [Treponema sp.]
MEDETSFSFDEIRDSAAISMGLPSYVTASDGIKLAYHSVPADQPAALLIFVHGGGAYSGSGYQYPAKGLSEKYNVSVYLPDLRGHGNSEGPRGDAPSSSQVLKDLDLFVETIQKQNADLPLYLGGHSSGGGLILNYLTNFSDTNIAGYIFLSPHFGYKSKTERKTKKPFTKVKTGLFIINGMSQGKKHGNTPAVFFNYPENVLKETPLLVTSITVNMALAVTPDDPRSQFGNIGKPFGLFIGEDDELFIPEKVLSYGELPGENVKNASRCQIIKNAKHLSILTIADQIIGNFILETNEPPRSRARSKRGPRSDACRYL